VGRTSILRLYLAKRYNERELTRKSKMKVTEMFCSRLICTDAGDASGMEQQSCRSKLTGQPVESKFFSS
jgi:hypothetical protein